MKKAVLLLSFLLVILTPSFVFASPSNNPVYATIDKVQQMITSATAGLQNEVNGLDQKGPGLSQIDRVINIYSSTLPIKN